MYYVYLHNQFLILLSRDKRKQSMIGTVVSTKCKKSVTVQVVRKVYVPKYNSYRRKMRKVMAHDEEELGRLGDVVRIVPCRPMSRKKRHSILDFIRKVPQLGIDEKGDIIATTR